MKLITGKCKEEFHKWFCESEFSDEIHVSDFLEIPLPMQWGVILEFADSKGYHMTTYQMDYQNWFGYKITAIFILSEIIEMGIWRRKECMEKAIKHFNKLYNEAT